MESLINKLQKAKKEVTEKSFKPPGVKTGTKSNNAEGISLVDLLHKAGDKE